MKLALFGFLCVLPLSIFAQKDSLEIKFFWFDEPLELKHQFSSNQVEPVFIFSTIQLYVSSGKENVKSEDFKLLDASTKDDNWLYFDQGSAKHITLGVDSILHQQGVFEGALDPIHGMYWAWQSGYINLKIEGMILIDDGSVDFTYHIGGYQFPNATSSVLSIPSGTKQVQLHMEFLADELEKTMIMSPSPMAHVFWQHFVQSIEFIK